MPDEFGEHPTGDQRPFLNIESLQIPRSMLVFLLFSSAHSFFYRVQLRDWDGHCRCLVLCSVTHFCFDFDVCFWSTVLLVDPNMAKISSPGCQVLIQSYLIESMMPCKKVKGHSIKDTAEYIILHMGYFLSLYKPNPF